MADAHPSEDDERRELRWLRRSRDLSHRLAAESDAARLLPLILDSAIELAGAERGFLVLVVGRKRSGRRRFKVKVARGFDQATLRSARGHVSRTVVERVLVDDGPGLIATSSEHEAVLAVTSVQDRRVRSIACVPMRLRGTPLGVLYLDHRFDDQAFRPGDLGPLRTFADQAALALETAELRARRDEDAARLGAALRELDQLRAEAADPEPGGRTLGRFGGLRGGSPAMLGLYEQIERSARAGGPILIRGEAGAGKTLVARELHARAAREGEPLVVAAGAAGGDLAEVVAAAPGRGGVWLLVHDVADLSPGRQVELLGALKEGRLAGRACQVLAATARDLRTLADEGRFRQDLFFRLDVQRVGVPPLRERPDDVLPLARELAAEAGASLEPTPRAAELLRGYAWPGNVRELRNEVRRLVALGGGRVSAQQLSAEVRAGRGVARVEGELSGKTLPQVERQLVEAALREAGGNKARAARQLGIPRSTLYGLLERYGLT